jgi:hypothetical protein
MAHYIIMVSAAMSLYKIGQTIGMRHRASTYMADKADNFDLKIVYMYETSNITAVEGCLKALIKSKQYRKRKEVYQIDIDILKKLIHEHCGPAADDVARPNMSLVRSNNSVLSTKKGGEGGRVVRHFNVVRVFGLAPHSMPYFFCYIICLNHKCRH